MNQTAVEIIDYVFSVILLGSIAYGSYKKENFSDSVQYNTINFVASFVLGGVGFAFGAYGSGIRQFLIGTVSIVNLFFIIKKKLKRSSS